MGACSSQRTNLSHLLRVTNCLTKSKTDPANGFPFALRAVVEIPASVLSTLMSAPPGDVDYQQLLDSGDPAFPEWSSVALISLLCRAFPDIIEEQSDNITSSEDTSSIDIALHAMLHVKKNPGLIINRMVSFNCGATPLTLAAEWGQSDVVKALLDAGAQVDRRNLNGNSALSLAVLHAHDGVVELLLRAGCSLPNFKNVESKNRWRSIPDWGYRLDAGCFSKLSGTSVKRHTGREVFFFRKELLAVYRIIKLCNAVFAMVFLPLVFGSSVS